MSSIFTSFASRLGALGFFLIAAAPLASTGCSSSDSTPLGKDSNAVVVTCDPKECGSPVIDPKKCSDGSFGGGTGRCIKSASGGACGWEVRDCPTASSPCTDPTKCPDAGGVPPCTDPTKCGGATGGSGGTGGGGTGGGTGGGGADSGPIIGGGGTPMGACSDPTACGPRPGVASTKCSDGSYAGPTGVCAAKPDGTCAWEIRVCAVTSPKACAPADCGVAPAIACSDGSKPICEADATGKCSWALHCATGAECTPAECGPRPMSATCTCSDGSTGCNTGRCFRPDPTAKCQWENRVCPK